MGKQSKEAKNEPINYVCAEFNAGWLDTPSPFDALDDEWISIIKFFVFHIPAKGVSARGRSLASYHWGEKSKNSDYHALKKQLIASADMNKEDFKCVQNWKDMSGALAADALIDFPSDLTKVRVTYRKDKDGVCDSLCNHIRNAFAHGRLAFYQLGEETYIALEDINNKRQVSARMILSKTILLRWIKVIESGPFAIEGKKKSISK